MSTPAVRQGTRITEDAVRTQRALETGIITSAVDPNTNAVQGGAVADVFPRHIGAQDPMDELQRIKHDLLVKGGAGGPGGITGDTQFGKVMFTDRDAQWLARKQKAAELANFDSWFGTNFHKNNVAARKFAQEINPEYYASREQAMVDKAKMALRLKLIGLRGPKSEEDLFTLYALQRGLIKLDPSWDQIGYYNNNGVSSTDRTRFKERLMSIPRLKSLGQRKINAAVKQNPFGQGGPNTPGGFSPSPNTFMGGIPGTETGNWASVLSFLPDVGPTAPGL